MRKSIKTVIAILILLLIGGWIVLKFPFSTDIDHTIKAKVYIEGSTIEETAVHINGARSNYLFADEQSFDGRFYIEYYERTGRDGMKAGITWLKHWESQIIVYYQNATYPALEIDSKIIINEAMDEFAARLADGTIIATSDEMYRSYIKLYEELNPGSGGETDNIADGEIVKEFPSVADFDRDGVNETARVAAFDEGMYFELQVFDSEGQILWKDEAASAHVGWLSLFLCQLDGEDYLLRYSPYMGQGICSYRYELFFLDSSGNEIMVDSSSVDFDINFRSPDHLAFDTDEIAGFMNKVNAYLADSIVLLNTDQDLQFEDEPRLKDTLWWLDAEEGFTYDKTADLKDILEAYKEYCESIR